MPTPKKKIIHLVFPNHQSKFYDEEWLLQRAILTSLNELFMGLSRNITSIVFKALQKFHSADSLDETEINEVNYTFLLLGSVAGSASFPDHIPSLKNGYFVMLLRNL